MKNTYTLLHRLQKRFPTPVGISHNFTYDPVGLRLSIWFKEKWFQFIINDTDLYREPEALEKDIENLIWENIK